MARRVRTPAALEALVGLVGLLAVGAACSGSGSGATGKGAPDDARAAVAEPVVDVAVRPLGTASLEAWAWRRGPGKPSFDRALAAEKRGDLAAVERECAAALAADPGHLEAAWMLAVARVRLGKLDGVLAPLEIAAAGDWMKWGERSTELAVFAPFHATAAGKGWLRAADGYRQALASALAGAHLVAGRNAAFRPPRATGDVRVDHRAEVYAVSGGRWIRLTRTGGALAGALTSPGRTALAYASYREVARQGGKPRLRELRVGTVDLATGRATRELVLDDVVQATLGWANGSGPPELVVELVPAKGRTEVFTVDATGSRKPRAGGLPRGESLRIRPLAAERRRQRVPGVTADWDDLGTASALRLDRSRKVVAPPEGVMIDGDSLAWSPDGARLAFASVADDPCGEGAAREVKLYVADAGTGRVHTVATGERVPSPVWAGPTRLAFVDGDAVRVVDVTDGREVERLAGGGGVTTGVPGETRPCASDGEAPFAEPPTGDDGEDPDAEAELEVLAPPAPPAPPAPTSTGTAAPAPTSTATGPAAPAPPPAP